jgi:hypothetical protein
MKRAQGKSNIDIIKGYVAGERPFLQVGYTGDADKYIIRKEGETWTDASGKQWIQTASGPRCIIVQKSVSIASLKKKRI